MKANEIDFVADMLLIAMETKNKSKRNRILDNAATIMCSGEETAAYSQMEEVGGYG